MKTYEALAKAFVREEVAHCFALLGDANMHWAGALAEQGVSFIYTRHEHAAVAASTAYARASNKVGVSTVTCGPGLTQIMTILPIAVRARIPLVIFAGEAPLNKPWYNQSIDQAPFVEACGAQYHALHQPKTFLADIHNAFATAKRDRVPVVVGVPFDLQQKTWDGETDLPTSRNLFVPPKPLKPNPKQIETAASWIAEASRPIVLAGLGVVTADAKAACVELAEQAGALLATTLPAKGLFHDELYCLGVAGGFATERSKAIFAKADLIIGIGARLASHTFDGGSLAPDARVIHLDIDPQGSVQGRAASDLQVASDAGLGAQALCQALEPKQAWRTDEMAELTEQALDLPNDTETPDGLLHPMAAVKALEQVIPAHCHVVNTSGHSAYYTAHMNRHPQQNYTVIREFGAIGNGTSFAMGVATARPDTPVVLIDGDGSALMHIQECEVMARHGMNILIIVLNDGAFGSEVHKLRADGVSDEGSVFGRPDFAAIGRGFGLQAASFTDLNGLPESLNAFLNTPGPAIWDIHISDKIASPQIVKAHKAALHNK